MKKYWIVVADQKEIPLIDSLIKFDIEAEFHVCGIGLLESVYHFSETLCKAAELPAGILLAGTAGSPDSDDLFKVCLTNQFLYPQFLFEELPEFLPEKWSTQSFLPESICRAYLDKPVYSSFGISKNTKHFSECMLPAWENMEALSLSWICYKRKIPFMALLCCTNALGSRSRQEWKENYIQAGKVLQEELRRIFKNVSPKVF
ncbi:MAG: hypothetical protein OEV66_01260 [Spirochaetia bacterium]|nr:hypothetical protein [Spirochaetia bacterium]